MEQKKIIGGAEEDSLKLCGEERPLRCNCGTPTQFYCCPQTLVACTTAQGCPDNHMCAEV